MSEFIVIQVGQCGNQIGGAFWPLILQEYDIKLNNFNGSNNSINSFFNVQNHKSIKARAICIDMEDSVIARFRNGPLRSLFDKKSFVTNYPGSGNNWAEGYHQHGEFFKEQILTALQFAVERCDSLHGFLLMFSTGGGTGSGLGTYVLNLLAEFYPNVERFVTAVYPTGTEDVITCPYNMSFATNELISNASCVFPVENRALLNILSRQKKIYDVAMSNEFTSMFRPFEDMNSIVVNMLLHLTSGSRFPGTLNFDMNDLNTNMVPFPKLHFLSTGFSPAVENRSTSFIHRQIFSKQFKTELFLSSCNRMNQLVKVDPLAPHSVLLGTTLIGRGDYTISDMKSYIEKLQSKGNFTPWSLKSVKIGLCNQAPFNCNMAMFSIINTTSMVNLIHHIYSQFIKLYKKKAHVHHYIKVVGFEEEHFQESQENLKDLIKLYGEVEKMPIQNVPRLSANNI